jgi:hypothetical protein
VRERNELDVGSRSKAHQRRLPSWRSIEARLALSLASCDRGAEPSLLSEPVGEAALHPGRLGVPSAAVAAVADARCARAQRCNAI